MKIILYTNLYTNKVARYSEFDFAWKNVGVKLTWKIDFNVFLTKSCFISHTSIHITFFHILDLILLLLLFYFTHSNTFYMVLVIKI